MKILALSDLHSGQDVLTNLENFLSKEKFDLSIIPGDITNPNSDALGYVTSLASIFNNFKLPWFCVHGNNDREPVIDFLQKNHVDLHFEPQTIAGYKFIGIGGWGYELPPYELKFDQKTIFVTHIPPRVNPHRQPPPADSRPLMHLAGHEHRWEKFYDLGPTRVVNLPSVKFSNHAAVIVLPEKEVVFFNLPQKQILE